VSFSAGSGERGAYARARRQDVCRLQVAMEEAALVGSLDGGALSLVRIATHVP